MRVTRLALAAVAVAAILGVTGCGGDESASSEPAASETFDLRIFVNAVKMPYPVQDCALSPLRGGSTLVLKDSNDKIVGTGDLPSSSDPACEWTANLKSIPVDDFYFLETGTRPFIAIGTLNRTEIEDGFLVLNVSQEGRVTIKK